MGKRNTELYSCSVCPRAAARAKTQTVAEETGRCMGVDLVSTIAAERPVCLSCFD